MSDFKNILIDHDPSMRFEIQSVGRKIFNFFLVPLLNHLPTFFLPYAVKTHRAAAKVVTHKTQHTALEILYQNGATLPSRNFLEKIALWVWFGLDNPLAVRNRLKIVRREIQNELATQLAKKEIVTILSIASGSARAVLEAIANSVEKYRDRKMVVHFLDKNPKATEYSKKLAEELKLFPHSNISMFWITDTVGNYLKSKIHSKERVDIIEMVGLLDYFDAKKSEETFVSVRSLLSDNGLFVCANVADNSERPFLTNFLRWKMIYKSPEELLTLLQNAGFPKGNIVIFREPLKVHSVTSARNVVS